MSTTELKFWKYHMIVCRAEDDETDVLKDGCDLVQELEVNDLVSKVLLVRQLEQSTIQIPEFLREHNYLKKKPPIVIRIIDAIIDNFLKSIRRIFRKNGGNNDEQLF